jgi:hypothetical protein
MSAARAAHKPPDALLRLILWADPGTKLPAASNDILRPWMIEEQIPKNKDERGMTGPGSDIPFAILRLAKMCAARQRSLKDKGNRD